ncbi:MAG: MBL fold metallo-hydrolase, partial [Leptospiraceae bacterium]|nr:MBL fold metallo-hydrolase [Leptospiraceae bacterium]
MNRLQKIFSERAAISVIVVLLLFVFDQCLHGGIRMKNLMLTQAYRVHTPGIYNQDHHHPDGGFRNPWPPNDYSGLSAAGWMLGRAFRSLGSFHVDREPLDAADLQWAVDHPTEGIRTFWIGHSTALIQMGETFIITDPVFSDRVSPVSFAGPTRLTPLPIQLEDIPRIDAVIISHNHYDHLDTASLHKIHRIHEPLFLVPLGVQQWFLDEEISGVIELDWWQYIDLDDIRLHCMPARHFSNRGLTDRNETLWSGWYLQDRTHAHNSVFYAGDTGYADHFDRIRTELGAPRLALIPIGAYKPRWFMREVHVDPAEALQAFQDLQAAHMIGVHWGTFDLADEGIDEPAT